MKHPLPNDDGLLERRFVVTQLRRFREMLQDEIDKDLEEVKLSAHWLLSDICEYLDLTPKETYIALG